MSNQLENEKLFREEVNKNIDMMIKIVGLKGNYKDLHFLAWLLSSYQDNKSEFGFGIGLRNILSNVKLPDVKG